ncbi:MAG: glycosyltransferase family 4 protein [Blastocatellia bacterium]
MTGTWHIITGEYPPQPGGVSDYTEQLARGLACHGDKVHVWCPAVEGDEAFNHKVETHRISGLFSPAKLFELGKALNGFEAPRTLLVQYAPNAFGLRGLNLFICLWLLSRSIFSKDDVRVMFHEPFFYFARQSLRRNLLAAVNRLMAALLLAASRVVYISIPAWEPMLRRYDWFGRTPMKWLPIPSTIPRMDDDEAVKTVRRRYSTDESKLIVGHFGTYGERASGDLAPILAELLKRRADLLALCVGARGDKFVADLICAHPELQGRVFAPGLLSREEVSLHLQACDLAIQPFPDGASSRRTSLMAQLANRVPVITTSGELSESLWSQSGAVRLAVSGDTAGIVALAITLIEDGVLRKRTGEMGLDFYAENFSLDRSLEKLIEQKAGAESKFDSFAKANL